MLRPRKDISATREIEGETIDGKFKIGPYLGKGSFGEIRTATLTDEPNKKFCVKAEPLSMTRTLLVAEAEFYQLLQDNSVREGFAEFFLLSAVGRFRVMVLELLGPNLAQCFERCQGQLSQKTTIQIAIQLMHRIESLHSCGIVYRDIKPENILLGRPDGPKARVIHLVDFGLATSFLDESKNHIAYSERAGPSGTARYMSINSHNTCVQSRRDDMQSIGYLLVYFLRGSLPWQGLDKVNLLSAKDTPATRRAHMLKAIVASKEATTVGELCKGLPRGLRKYLRTARELTFTQKPDYDDYREMFEDTAEENRILLDNVFDWDVPSEETSATELSSEVSTVASQSENVPEKLFASQGKVKSIESSISR